MRSMVEGACASPPPSRCARHLPRKRGRICFPHRSGQLMPGGCTDGWNATRYGHLRMTITVTPFANAGCGADIGGVDIRRPLTPAERDAIRAAWLEHLVLRFRDQPMTDSEHMAFTRQFGELEFAPSKLMEKSYGVGTEAAGRRDDLPPEITVISNIVEGGKPIGGLGDGEAFWHTDSSFVEVPPAASLLRAIEVPPAGSGGSTYFLNMYAAYETLPA